MASLFAALGTASSALNVLEQAIGVVQNNVTNATTPGYVTQTLQMAARPFNASQDLWGGVEASGVSSARDLYAEQAVWSASEQAGLATQQSTSLNALQQTFDVSGQGGVPGALSSLYSAFSAWSANPADATSRQQVISAAQGLAGSFNQAAQTAGQIRAQTDQQLVGTVGQINQYASQIAGINGLIRQGSGSDAGLQTRLYNTIEQLSNLAPISVLTESDGTATVLLGGQSPLVIGQTSNALSLNYAQQSGATYPNAAPDAQLVSSSGQDITALANSGTLGGQLTFRNTTIAAVLGDGSQQGSLNQLAQGVADRVNALLTSGQNAAGPPAVPGVPLFSYSAAAPTSVAGSLTLSSTVNAAQLAAIDPGPPSVANGTAAHLAQLANPQQAVDMLNGLSYTAYYAGIAAGIGQQAASASANADAQGQVLTQAQTLRAQVSGVSLNDQAVKMLQFQQAYQASAQMITVINNITQTLLTTMQQLQ